MTRPKLNFLVDGVLFILMAGIIFIGILLGWATDTGPQGTKVFWSLHRHQWGDIHLWLSLTFVVVLLIHLVLHWQWIRGSARRILGGSWRLIPVLLAPALLIWALWSLQPDQAATRGRHGIRAGSARSTGLEADRSLDSPRRHRRERRRGGRRGL